MHSVAGLRRIGRTLAVAAALIARRASPSCNVIPPAIQPFRSSVGSVDRPFAGPGDWVELGSDRCVQTAGLPDAVDQLVMSVFFTTPDGGPVTAVILTPDACDSPATTSQLGMCERAMPLGARTICRHVRTAGPVVDVLQQRPLRERPPVLQRGADRPRLRRLQAQHVAVPRAVDLWEASGWSAGRWVRIEWTGHRLPDAGARRHRVPDH
jgi:hypothetical protein